MIEFHVNPEFRTSPLDAACAQPSALCIVGTPGGTQRYAMPIAVVDFIGCFEPGSTVEGAIARFRATGSGQWSDARLRALVDKVLLPRRILLDNDAQAFPATPPVAAVAKPKSFLTLKVPLLRGARLDAAAAALAWLFAPAAVAVSIPLVVAVQILFFAVIAPGHALNLDRLHAGGILALMALTTLSTLAHEFGHVAAAARYRCRNLEIGWGLYLIFTVMYSDVSEAWGLPRRQRMVVDFGGVYLQSISLGAFLVAFYLTSDEIWLFGFLVSTSTITASANPILRLDGYWIVSDYFGILNLRAMSTAWAHNAFRRWILREPVRAAPLPISRAGVAVVGLYSVATALFMFYVVVFLFEHMFLDVLVAYPSRLAAFYQTVRASSGPLEMLSLGFEMFWRSMIIFGLVSFVVSKGGMIVRFGGGILESYRTRSSQLGANAHG